MAIVQSELRAVPATHLILGGLSQGCAMSLAVLLCLDHQIGGYIGMSGFFCYQSDIQDALAEEELNEDDPFSAPEPGGESPHASVRAQTFERDLLGLSPLEQPGSERTAYSTPVFLGHGVMDEKVPLSLGSGAAQVMRDAGYQVQWKTYENQGHWYKIPDEIDDIAEFISSVVGWAGSSGEPR